MSRLHSNTLITMCTVLFGTSHQPMWGNNINWTDLVSTTTKKRSLHFFLVFLQFIFISQNTFYQLFLNLLLDLPPPQACQHNREKSSTNPWQNRHRSKSHTLPQNCDASAASNPLHDNQQVPQESQYKNKFKSTSSPNLSISAALLWPILPKKRDF